MRDRSEESLVFEDVYVNWLRSWCRFTREADDKRRMVSCSVFISREKTSVGTPARAACSAMFSASAVLPMEGRAARMTRSPRLKPPVMRSRSS